MNQLPKHENNGHCDRCALIFNKYPGFNVALRNWFDQFQSVHVEAHISCAGRGQEDQEALLFKKATKAKWTKSAHNWNCAIDLFCQIVGTPDIYDIDWFNNVLGPAIPDWITWYGAPHSPFFELPHIELRVWRSLADQGAINLVE